MTSTETTTGNAGRGLTITAAIAAMIGVAFLPLGFSEEPRDPRNPSSAAGAESTAERVERPTVEAARRQAEILHKVMHSTLHSVHDRYYRVDEGLPIPAAVLKEIFADVEREQQVQFRWLAVEGQAMNTDHKPQNAFEHEAFDALKSGKPFYEQTENGVYRRAGAITLNNQCLKCHVPDRKNTKDRTTGLIIAIPIQEK